MSNNINTCNQPSSDKASDKASDIGNTVGLCCRQSGEGVLRERARRLRKEADDLETLINMLPRDLTAAQDEALWSIAIQKS